MKSRKFLVLLLSMMLLLALASSSFAQSTAPTPIPDTDGDGIDDASDSCPREAGPVDNRGCPRGSGNNNSTTRPTDAPPPDSDADGTADPLDRCPTEFGDGANGGCPATTTTNSSPALTPELPLAAPTLGACVISTQGNTDVNIRQYPDVDAPIVGVISPNEWLEVLAVYDYGNIFIYSQNGMGNEEAPDHQFPILAEPIDPNYPVWFLVMDTNASVGWVAEAVVRTGGDCSDFVVENPDPDTIYFKVVMRDVVVSSYQGGVHVGAGDVDGDGRDDHNSWIDIESFSWGETAPEPHPLPIFPNENPFIAVALDPQEAAVDYYLKLDGVEGESNDSTDTSQRLIQSAEGCELIINSVGTIEPVCDDGGTPPSVTICVYQQLTEVGVYTQVCYEVEIPEGCVINTSEAGVWHITCEEDGDGVQVTPVGETAPILDIQWDGNSVQIGLLLPAVQKVREAAAR